jgi:hypothetical protein
MKVNPPVDVQERVRFLHHSTRMRVVVLPESDLDRERVALLEG